MLDHCGKRKWSIFQSNLCTNTLWVFEQLLSTCCGYQPHRCCYHFNQHSVQSIPSRWLCKLGRKTAASIFQLWVRCSRSSQTQAQTNRFFWTKERKKMTKTFLQVPINIVNNQIDNGRRGSEEMVIFLKACVSDFFVVFQILLLCLLAIQTCRNSK
jgi:hypothetical protein